MAQDFEDKTEAATPKRREEARNEGRIAMSADLTSAVGLLAALVVLGLLGQSMVLSMLRLTREAVSVGVVSGDALSNWITHCISSAALILLPFLATVLVLTAVGALTQTGGAVTGKRLLPKPGQLSPLKGIHRIFSWQSLARLVAGILKMLCAGTVAWMTIRGELDRVLASGLAPTVAVLPLAGDITYKLALRLALTLLVLAILDYFYQRWSMERSLRMTKQEVKDEMRNLEGDPMIKQRRRQVQLKLAMQRLQNDVPRADVVVTNPTHFSVALRYDEATMAAPRVVAKGKDFLALRIRQIAEQHGIPVVERPPLARALFAACEVGQEVPATYYRAVAELLAYVYQLSGRATQRA